MAIDLSKLGIKGSPTLHTIDPARAIEYAAATNDPNEAYTSGKYAPPIYAVVPAVDAMGAAASDIVPPEALLMIVHGEQDMHFHRPLVPGMTLSTVAEPYSVRVSSSGTRLTVRIDSADDADGAPVVEQYFTVVIRGMSDGESGGPDKPDHTFPETARSSPVGEFSVHVDDDQTFRYSKASGDMMPIHLDENVAKSVGLPGIIAHGLCTMAMCSQAVLSLAGGGDPSRLARLAVRFSTNVFPGNDVLTRVFSAGSGSAAGRACYAFEATSAGDTVIKNGWAEIS